MNEQYKYLLDESQLPKAWYNINADMPTCRPRRCCIRRRWSR
jgi:tryptophan synthase beta chain